MTTPREQDDPPNGATDSTSMALFDRFRLNGRRALVTGGSRGLGREMALALAEAGADVVIVARDSAALETTAADIRALGRRAWALEGDLGDPETCEALCERCVADVGDISILVNNVGGRRIDVPTECLPLDTWRTLVDLNLTSVYLCSRIVGGAMIAAGRGGRIINVSSVNALVAGRGIGGRHYETTKAAVLQFTRTLAVDWAPYAITANAICPGLFMTTPNQAWSASDPAMIDALIENIPLGVAGSPEDLGPLVVYLASDAARYVTGASIVIDGGYTCL